ncbi:MAG: hypothetical protein FJ091_02760 [Deltaproteobacteria bacterium]|nr:hypothetical protein [Deltaproteobacteria bacterium]
MTTPSPTARDRIALGAALLLFFAALAHFQFASPRLYDGDSYFHARAAQQLAEHGVRREFPQTAFSTWRDRYSDKDFLFHVALIPFVGENASVPGAKRAALALGALVLGAFGFALARLRVRFAWAAVLLLAASEPWIWLHLVKVRPHLLGLALLLVEIVLVLEGRWKTLALVAAAHTLAHTSFLTLLALPIAHTLASRMRGQPLPWKPAAGIALGIIAASLLHPYFPNNLSIAFDQAIEVARSVSGARADVPPDVFGSELMPISLAGILQLWPVWAGALAAGAALLARWRVTPPSSEALTLFGFAAALLLACGLANRFAFFLVPVAVLAAWRAASECFGESRPRELLRSGHCAALGGALALCIALGAARTLPALPARIAAAEAPAEKLRPAIAFLDRRAQPSDVVYHNFWIPFAPLYYYRPNGTYIEALDPIFLYRFDP